LRHETVYPEHRDAVLVRQELFDDLRNVDALLFDIDGVLLDTVGLFRSLVGRTVHTYFGELKGWTVDCPMITKEETRLFRLAGGFDNYWDLTLAVVWLYWYKWLIYQTTVASQLRDRAPTLEEYAEEIERRGGGPHGAESYLHSRCSPEQRRELTLAHEDRVVIRIFQEYYGGDEWCAELYGVMPQYVHGPGFAEQERVILNLDYLPRRINKIGIFTGRTPREAKMALRRVGLDQRLREDHVLNAGAGYRRPEPDGLIELARRLQFRLAIYVGDTLDDLRMVQNYAAQKPNGYPRIIDCSVLSGPSGDLNYQLFLEHDAQIISPDVNALLELLKAHVDR